MQLIRQKKLLDDLKRFESKMTEKEKYQYKMFLKRQLDEEDFDSISFRQLTEMHTKFMATRVKPDLDSLFKKPSPPGETNE